VTRRDFVKATSALAGVVTLEGGASCENSYGQRPGPAKKLAMVFIAIEGIARLMGCYGHPVVGTSNIDALAGRGVVFNNTYCRVAVRNPNLDGSACGETLGVFGNSVYRRPRIPVGMLTLPEFFRDKCYETITFQKLRQKEI